MCSCASKTTPKQIVTYDADLYLQKILDLNTARYPVRGTGELIITKDDTVQKLKSAFASDGINKIRLEILTPAGLPAVSISYDGNKLYFRENDGSKTKTFSNYKKVLKKVTGASPDIKLLSFLFTKKIPLIEFEKALTLEDSGNKILYLISDKEKQSITLKDSSSGFFSEIITPEDRFIIDFKENGDFKIISEQTGSRILFTIHSSSKIKNEILKNIFILTR
jgi:hypothetical protein